MHYLILVLLILSTSLAETEKPPLDWNIYSFQSNCTLFDIQGNKKTYPGHICQFLQDGSFISINETSLKRFSPTQEVTWEIEGHFHHQLNLSLNKKRILTLMSDIGERSKKRVRDDVVIVLDGAGKIIHQMKALEILKQAKVTPQEWPDQNLMKRLNIDFETSHFNSIYEIPQNKYGDTYQWMRPGNIIINSYSLGVFILSPDLQKVLYHKELPFSNDHEFHDVQVTQDGEFLLFNNYRKNSKEKDIPHSAIQKYDPVTDKLTFEYTAKEKQFFYSPACGGVQEFTDFLFFSHITNGSFFYSKLKKEIILALPGFAGEAQDIVPTQQTKIVDVREFLKKTK